MAVRGALVELVAEIGRMMLWEFPPLLDGSPTGCLYVSEWRLENPVLAGSHANTEGFLLARPQDPVALLNWLGLERSNHDLSVRP